MPQAIDTVIHADPNKAFFIEMLTRDISLVECVLDLIDNSLHSLVRETNLDVMQLLLGKAPTNAPINATIEITFSPLKFAIRDNCGGISIDDAADEVFQFGRETADKSRPGLGVYGIGMKRALFKLGKLISVQSTTKNERFTVNIDVPKWKKAKEWKLRFTNPTRLPKGETHSKTGTTISISTLNELAHTQFKAQSFETELKRRIATCYALFISAGVTIEVNNRAVAANLPSFAESDDLTTTRQHFKHDGVDVLILAGLSPRSDRTPRGWYVFCNGRMVVESNKDWETGWGDNAPVYHSKYNHFLGFAYFKSKDGSKLPWKTTKAGVERESSVYQAALGEMRVATRNVTRFLNRLYPSDLAEEGFAEREVLKNAKATSVDSVARRNDRDFEAKPKRVPDARTVNIIYKRPRKEVEKARRALGETNLSAAKIGEATFDYFIERECE